MEGLHLVLTGQLPSLPVPIEDWAEEINKKFHLQRRAYLNPEEIERAWPDKSKKLEKWFIPRSSDYFVDGDIFLSPMAWVYLVRIEALMRMKVLIPWEDMNPRDFALFPLKRFVNPVQCLFISHCWRTKEHPDPDGTDLALIQSRFQLLPERYLGYEYVWIDFCCLPQKISWSTPSAALRFSHRALANISALLTNCDFIGFYVPNDKRKRAWVFYEIFAWRLLHQSSPEVLVNGDSYLEKIDEFLRSENSLSDFVHEIGMTTAEVGDLSYLVKSLTVLLKLRSHFSNLSYVHCAANGITDMTVGESLTGTFSVDSSTVGADIIVDLDSAQVSVPSLDRNLDIDRVELARLLKEESTFTQEGFSGPCTFNTAEMRRLIGYARQLIMTDDSQLRLLGELINKEFGMDGMVVACEMVRDRYNLLGRYNDIENAWDGIGEWQR